jgi:valyl-tRNA synthetase
LQEASARVEKGLAGFELNETAQALYEYTWHEFCDWFIELSKLPLREGGARRLEALYTLHHVLETVCRLMHPMMPFVTEELWQSLPWKQVANTPARIRDGKPAIQTLMFQAWPRANESFGDTAAETEVAHLRAIIEAIRNFRGENNISPKVDFPVRYHAANAEASSFMQRNGSVLRGLSRIGGLESVERGAVGELDAILPLSNLAVELRISLAGLVNVEEEAKRLKKEVENVEKDLAHVRGKLSRETFIAKAPPALVEAEKVNEQKHLVRLKELEAALARLSKLSGK